jgi:RNA polymerase sigma factor (sigma-70 family)
MAIDHERTSWTLVRGAGDGVAADRRAFARIYSPIVRAYLGARWQGSPLANAMDDAAQDVFLDCFREGGALSRADPERGARFRTFLYGVVRNIARRHEERLALERARQPQAADVLHAIPADEARLSRVFDRAWAIALLQRAVARQREAARGGGEAAIKRVELLELRFGRDLPIREIARVWDEDPAVVHRQYARAREAFKRCLREEVAAGHAGTPGEIERECANLLSLIG